MRSASIIAVALAVLAAAPVARAEDAAAVTGTWVTPEGRSRIAITESDGKYCGKIVWLKEYNYSEDEEDAGQPRRDKNNPDPAKRDRPIFGLPLLNGFEYAGDGVWRNGTIYNPENGKTYKCKLTLTGKNTLHARGYVGISILGRTSVWKRYREPKPGKETDGGKTETPE